MRVFALTLFLLTRLAAASVPSAPVGLTSTGYAGGAIPLAWTYDSVPVSWYVYVNGTLRAAPARSQVGVVGAQFNYTLTSMSTADLPASIYLVALGSTGSSPNSATILVANTGGGGTPISGTITVASILTPVSVNCLSGCSGGGGAGTVAISVIQSPVVVANLTPQFTQVPYPTPVNTPTALTWTAVVNFPTPVPQFTQLPYATAPPTATPITFPTQIPLATVDTTYHGVTVTSWLAAWFTPMPTYTTVPTNTPVPTATPITFPTAVPQFTAVTFTAATVLNWTFPTVLPTATPITFPTAVPYATPGGAVSQTGGPWTVTAPAGVSLNNVLTKGTQSTTGLSVQNLKDSGRVNLVFYATAVAAGASGVETAITLNKAADTGATSAAVSFVITNGKRFRISSILVATRGDATATAQQTIFNFRINTGGAVTTSSIPIVFSARSATPATANAWDRFWLPIPDGLEFLGNGTVQFGMTAAATYAINAPTWDVLITGFEY